MLQNEIEIILDIKNVNPAQVKSGLIETLGFEEEDIVSSTNGEELTVQLPYPYDMNMEKIIDFSDDNSIVLKSGGDEIRGAKPKWEKHMIRDDDGNIDVEWNHKVIGLDEAIEKAKTEGKLDISLGHEATGLKIFQLDTGLSVHERLTNYPGYKKELAKNFFDEESDDALDDNGGFPQGPGHATSTGFTIIGTRSANEVFDPARREGKKLDQALNRGLFPYVSLIPVRIARSVLLTKKTRRSMYKGVEYAVQNGADVISMSMAGFGKSRLFNKTAKLAYDNGVLFVCASGSEVDFISDVMNPAALRKTIGVGGISTQRKKGIYEVIPLPRGNDGRTLDVSAPARWVYTAGQDEDGTFHRLGIGTSQSAAHVAAAAALWKHYWKNELAQFNITPHKIVDAFKWSLKHTNIIPDHWSKHDRRENREF